MNIYMKIYLLPFKFIALTLQVYIFSRVHAIALVFRGVKKHIVDFLEDEFILFEIFKQKLVVFK